MPILSQISYFLTIESFIEKMYSFYLYTNKIKQIDYNKDIIIYIDDTDEEFALI